MPFSSRAPWRQAHLGVFLATFGLLVTCITPLGYTAFHVIETQRVDRIIEREQIHLENDKAFIINAMQLATKDIARLSVSVNMHEFLKDPSADNMLHIEREFALLLEGNPQYSQVRYLNTSGREILRVENGKTGPVIVDPTHLQDKSQRPYVQAAMRLAPGEIYVSALDLNVEHGVIENPFHPMLRLVQVVPGRDGRGAGFLVLNYSAREILDILRDPRDEEDISTIQLLDDDGHWLIAPDPGMEWGWLLGKPEQSLANLEPEVWRHMQLQESTVFDVGDEVLVYIEIDLSKDLTQLIFQRAAKDSLRFNFEFPVVPETSWTLIDVIERDELGAGAMLNQKFVWAFVIALYLITLLLSYVISLFYGRQELARARLLEESQRREKQLDGFIEAAPVGIVVSNAAGEIQRVNSRLEDMLGYQRHELIGKGIDMLVPQHLRAEFASKRTSLGLTAEDLSKEIGLDFSAQKKDGSLRPVDIALGNLQSEGSSLIISSMRDISMLKEAERKLKLATTEAEKANQAKSVFLANMSHEIRTPLNAVLGNTHLLKRNTQLDETASTQVSRILRAGNALLSIINDILDLSKIEAGELRLEQRPLRLTSLLLDVEAIGSSQANQKGIDFIVDDLPSDLCPDVVTDDVRLRQILLNLVSNAVKFTLKGQVHIAVERTKNPPSSLPNAQWVTFHVSDTGIGIANDQKDHLFEPFKQADSSTTRIFGGSGLGLTIVQELCHALGGTVTFESALGKGSRFSVTIPLTLASEQEIERSGLQVRPLQILVCEDDPQTGQHVIDICSQLGWQAEICSDGPGLGQRLAERLREAVATDCLIMEGQAGGRCNFERLARLEESLANAQLPAVLFLNASPSGDAAPHMPDLALHTPWDIMPLPLDVAKLFNAVSSMCISRQGAYSSLLSRSRMDQSDVLWLAGAKFLVVDDSNANREVASSILKSQGAQVVGCENGQEALTWLADESNHVDLVLMDIQMPIMDGNQAVMELRKIDRLRDLPVIALTAAAFTSEKDMAISAGMTDYMTKPFDPERMVRLLRQHLEASLERSLPVKMRAAAGVSHPVETGPGGEPLAWPILPGVDLVLARQRLSNDRALFGQLLNSLFEEFADLQSPWPLPSTSEEAKELAARAHKFAGNASLVAATRLYELAKEIEIALADASSQETLPDLSKLCPSFALLSQMFCGLGAAVAEMADPKLAEEETPHDGMGPQGNPGQIAAAAAEGLDTSSLAELREALNLRKISALDLLQGLEPTLKQQLSQDQWARLKSAKSKLDFQGILDVLAPLGEPSDALEIAD